MLNTISAILNNGVSAAVGDYESIQTVTVGAGGSASISFTSIPSTFSHLQIRWMCLNSSQQTDLKLNFNSDTGANYSYHQLYGSGSAVGASAGASATLIYAGVGGFTSNPAAGIGDILDYSNTTKYKTYRGLTGIDENGSGYVMMKSGLWQNTNAITSIIIAPAGGNFNQYSKFALYGVK